MNLSEILLAVGWIVVGAFVDVNYKRSKLRIGDFWSSSVYVQSDFRIMSCDNETRTT